MVKHQGEGLLSMIAIHFIVSVSCNETIIEIGTLNQMLFIIDVIAYIQSMPPFCLPGVKLSKGAVVEIGRSSIYADAIIP
jgi:hypothetical protein